jgi:hypothetical protein
LSLSEEARQICRDIGQEVKPLLDWMRQTNIDPSSQIIRWRQLVLKTGTSESLTEIARMIGPDNRRWLIMRIKDMEMLGRLTKKKLIQAIRRAN